MIKLNVNGVETSFKVTMFPDGTSQVWQVNPLPKQGDEVEILWMFENEAELFHVCQLGHLLDKALDGSEQFTLNCPYLPYARQDKDVDNKLSFALNTFQEVLNSAGIYTIKCVDAHSSVSMAHSIGVTMFHKAIWNHDVICYPDKGATTRYVRDTNIPMIYCEKMRNQLTGDIVGMDVIGANYGLLQGKKILIVDDICDGGATFISIALALRKYFPGAIDLAVTHGLFSKGKQVLHDAGIRNIYTTNSLLRNPEGYKVVEW
jgi:ribose-phosphate pyrophosphokinase